MIFATKPFIFATNEVFGAHIIIYCFNNELYALQG